MKPIWPHFNVSTCESLIRGFASWLANLERKRTIIILCTGAGLPLMMQRFRTELKRERLSGHNETGEVKFFSFFVAATAAAKVCFSVVEPRERSCSFVC